MGFRSVNPNAMTNAERQRRFRGKEGGRAVNCTLRADAAASMLYVKKTWGITTDAEAVNVALRFLAQETRKGLERLDLGFD
jgi:hypothetical protein